MGKKRRGRACVVVLGDIGRSPRMQYHSLSLALQASLQVDIVAYGGSEPHMAVLQNQSIHIHKMKQWPILPQGLPTLLKALLLLLKPLFQFFVLLWHLCFQIPAPDVFIVQNPPSVPTLVAVKWASWLRNSAFIVDWHNFGYTLLALSLGRNSRFVAVYRWFERQYGRMASGSLCVTKAMQHELAQNWGIKATVLYDQPPEFFRPTSLKEKHELFCRLDKYINQPCSIRDCASYGMGNHNVNETLFTTIIDGDIILKPHRPALVVSSTSCNKLAESLIPLDQVQAFFEVMNFEVFAQLDKATLAWMINQVQAGSLFQWRSLLNNYNLQTGLWGIHSLMDSDEDFSILLEAAVMYDRRVAAILNENDSVLDEVLWKEITEGKQYIYPRLLFVITGKGPEKEKYEEKIRRLHLKRVAFRTMWLSAEDYPLLLGSADLGVCLHTSSSGLDLPMKVVDMFGCGLPVCAVAYSCIKELVEVDKNGLLFSSSSELADELLMLFKGYPDECNALNLLRNGALEKSSSRWAAEWEEHAKPLITEVISKNSS